MFNKNIIVPANLTLLNSSVLELKVIPGLDSDPDLVNFTYWNAT